MKFENMLREDFVFTQKYFESKKDIILFFADQLKQKEYVAETFADAAIEREEKYPTGLYLAKINIAISHIDTKHVKWLGVDVLKLGKPVIYNKIDDPPQTISVLIIFLLSVLKLNEYVRLLSKLTESFFQRRNSKKTCKETDSTKIIMIPESKSPESKVTFVLKKEVFFEEVCRGEYLL